MPCRLESIESLVHDVLGIPQVLIGLLLGSQLWSVVNHISRHLLSSSESLDILFEIDKDVYSLVVQLLVLLNNSGEFLLVLFLDLVLEMNILIFSSLLLQVLICLR